MRRATGIAALISAAWVLGAQPSKADDTASTAAFKADEAYLASVKPYFVAAAEFAFNFGICRHLMRGEIIPLSERFMDELVYVVPDQNEEGRDFRASSRRMLWRSYQNGEASPLKARVTLDVCEETLADATHQALEERKKLLGTSGGAKVRETKSNGVGG